ncbi:MAG: cytochrome c [Opitutaceae bacterium]|nr:cytochrome c [Opitutaceae bacterium]
MKKTIWMLAFVPITFAASASRSIWDGVFSAEQIARGKKSYEAQCADCHGDELEGDGKKSTPLKGEAFFKNWKNKSVHRLIDTTRRTMPPDDPLTLSRDLCTDVVAYILSENGYPAAKADFGATAPDLRQIVIEPPKK